jgi:hypothetical protein
MIWDVDSYIVHEVGPIAVQFLPKTKLAPIYPGYRERVQETYQQMLREQHDRGVARRKKRADGAKG